MSNESIARAYLQAVGDKELQKLDAIVASDVRFTGPVMNMTGRADLIAALRRISAVHVRNDVQRLFADGDEVCVIYDFVTDTVGAIPTIEWLRIERGRIQSIKLFYDQTPWQRVREELARRAKEAS